MSNGLIEITFFDAQDRYAVRYWPQVPRVGDEVMLWAGRKYIGDSYGKVPFKVKRVVWGVEAVSRPKGYAVNIEVEPLGKLVDEENVDEQGST